MGACRSRWEFYISSGFQLGGAGIKRAKHGPCPICLPPHPSPHPTHSSAQHILGPGYPIWQPYSKSQTTRLTSLQASSLRLAGYLHLDPGGGSESSKLGGCTHEHDKPGFSSAGTGVMVTGTLAATEGVEPPKTPPRPPTDPKSSRCLSIQTPSPAPCPKPALLGGALPPERLPIDPGFMGG